MLSVINKNITKNKQSNSLEELLKQTEFHLTKYAAKRTFTFFLTHQ